MTSEQILLAWKLVRNHPNIEEIVKHYVSKQDLAELPSLKKFIRVVDKRRSKGSLSQVSEEEALFLGSDSDAHLGDLPFDSSDEEWPGE